MGTGSRNVIILHSELPPLPLRALLRAEMSCTRNIRHPVIPPQRGMRGAGMSTLKVGHPARVRPGAPGSSTA